MNTLMEAVHAVLMLNKRTSKHRSVVLPKRGWRVDITAVYLRQAGEDGRAAGRAAAHRGKGLPKHHAALSQRAEVRGADH